MNTQAGYTIEGVPSAARPRPASTGRFRWPVIALGTVALFVGAINIYLWMAGSGRAGAAVARIEKDAAAWRDKCLAYFGQFAEQRTPP